MQSARNSRMRRAVDRHRRRITFSPLEHSSRRQKPTRLPYSCHAQFGMSGIGDPPAGGVSTVRGIASRGFHSSTLTITHTTMRAPSGNARRGRSAMANRGCDLSGASGSVSPIPKLSEERCDVERLMTQMGKPVVSASPCVR